MVNYVYFVLAGECRLIEHMIIHEEKSFGKLKYSLYKTEEAQKVKIGQSRHVSRRGNREARQSIQVLTKNISTNKNLKIKMTMTFR